MTTARMRLLGAWKKPKPNPHSAIRQAMSSVAASAGITVSATRPGAHQPYQSDAAQDAGGIFVRQAPRQRRGEADSHRPGRHQQSGLDLAAMHGAFKIERERHKGQRLRRERRDGGQHRQPKQP